MRVYARATKRERSSWRTSGRRAASWPTTRPSRRNRGKGSLSPRVIWRLRGRLRHDTGKRRANALPELNLMAKAKYLDERGRTFRDWLLVRSDIFGEIASRYATKVNPLLKSRTVRRPLDAL